MAQGGSEPSMEEILSSIKRIIAEDPAGPRGRRDPAPAAAGEDEEVLELTDPVVPPRPMLAPAPVDDAPGFPPAFPPPPVAPRAPTREELISSTTAEASRAALAALSRMVVRPDDPHADNTLEGLVRELLRPMLKDWLDAHLPAIVSAAVQREVARITDRLP